LFTASLFESKYTGSDGVERNTAFNGNYVFNTLVGKEFKLSEDKSLVLDVKVTFAGGKRYTPIDEVASLTQGGNFTTVYFENQAYSKQFEPYLKADVKIGFKLDRKKITQEWQFFIENVTNQKNVLMQSYSKSKQAIVNTYQLGIFPMMQYKLYF